MSGAVTWALVAITGSKFRLVISNSSVPPHDNSCVPKADLITAMLERCPVFLPFRTLCIVGGRICLLLEL